MGRREQGYHANRGPEGKKPGAAYTGGKRQVTKKGESGPDAESRYQDAKMAAG